MAAVDCFISYSHEDQELRAQLEEHLASLHHQGYINTWTDRRIEAGEEWAKEVDKHLEEAGIVLLLVSSSFLASRYCYEIEMKRALELHEAGAARVIPVILRSCIWESAPFGKLQALPEGEKPITAWDDRDQAWLSVVNGIHEFAKKRKGLQPGSSSQTSIFVD